MLYDRFAATLDINQLNSVTLAIAHLIEQQYAQKLTDEQFNGLEEIIQAVNQRGLDSAATFCGRPISSSVFLGSYELIKKNPAIACNLFIDELLRITGQVDENLMPIVFLDLSVEKKKRIGDKICEVLTGNTNLIVRKDELRMLAEKLLGTKEVESRLEL
jgi:hypothetical protein